MAEEEKLKLGKGAAFVKSRLKSAPPERRDLGGRLPGAAQADRPERRPITWGWSSRRRAARSWPNRRSTAGPRSTTSPRSWPTPCGDRWTGTPVGPGSSVCGGTTSGGSCSRSWRNSGIEVVGRAGTSPASSRRTEDHLRRQRDEQRVGMVKPIRRAGEGRDDVPGHRPVRPRATATSRSATRRASGSSSGRSATAALDFEDDTPDTLAEAMAVLEAGLARWFEEQGVEPD